MKLAKKTLPAILIASFLLMPVAVVQAAVGEKSSGPGFEKPESDIGTAEDVVKAVNNVAGFLFKLFLALAVIFIIVAALFYLTAVGNQTQLDKAKNILIFAIVAIVIALIAGGITNFVGNILGTRGSSGSSGGGSSQTQSQPQAPGGPTGGPTGVYQGGTTGGGGRPGQCGECPAGYELIKKGDTCYCVQ